MGQSLQQVWPEAADESGTFSSGASGRPGLRSGSVSAGWRARNWRRVVLAWFVLSLVIMAVMAEPKTDFPKAQARSVPAVRMFFRVAGGLTAAGVPVVLLALP